MKTTIVYRQLGGDPFLYKEVYYNFSMGDTVYCDLSEEEIEELSTKYPYYPHYDCEGVISEKWIDISDMIVYWYIDIDF